MTALALRAPLCCLLAAVAVGQAAPAPEPLPALEAATRLWDSGAKKALDWPELMDRLAAADVVFLGETHLDDTTHRVELRVFEELLQRKRGKVTLSLEMFERDVQPAIDDYLAGRIDEATFRQRARPWPDYDTAWRPLVEAAKAASAPVLAANAPASLRRALARGGKQALDALPPEQRALLPDVIHPASDAYWQRVERAVRGHMGGGGAASAEERLYDAQNLWDNCMGETVQKARAAQPDRLVLHVVGGFHVAYRDGTVAQFARRAADQRAVVVEVVALSSLHAARPDRDGDQADYLVYAEALARASFEGTWAVEVPAELRYRLHVPEGPAAAPRPLLVWLPDRATRPQDAMAFWSAALGDDAIVAVVEHAFPETQPDLAAGGQWAPGDGFRADYARVQLGLERMVEYLRRRFPVDARRVLIAGDGEAGAAVLWSALYGDWLDVDWVAIDPADLLRLSREALPDEKPVYRSLSLLGRTMPPERLEQVAVDYRKVGGTAEVALWPEDGNGATALVRSRLGLPAQPAEGDHWLLLERDLPRARQWAEILAARLRREHGARVHVAAAPNVPAGADPSRVRRLWLGGAGHWSTKSFAEGEGLPLAGGSFGGTTVLVLPKGTSDEDFAAWQQLEQQRAIKRRSPFANLAIARLGQEPTLKQVVEQLAQRGRSRFLVVPAVFCADAAEMQALQQELGDAGAGLDLAWLPGLGAELAR